MPRGEMKGKDQPRRQAAYAMAVEGKATLKGTAPNVLHIPLPRPTHSRRLLREHQCEYQGLSQWATAKELCGRILDGQKRQLGNQNILSLLEIPVEVENFHYWYQSSAPSAEGSQTGFTQTSVALTRGMYAVSVRRTYTRTWRGRNTHRTRVNGQQEKPEKRRCTNRSHADISETESDRDLDPATRRHTPPLKNLRIALRETLDSENQRRRMK